MHWLYFSDETPKHLEEAGVYYDSTLGYNETVGYRSGTTQVFRLPGTSTVFELPLHVQDTAMFYPGRMGMSESEAMATVRGADWRLSKTHGGVFTINWHDRSLAPERNWDAAYLALLRHAPQGENLVRHGRGGRRLVRKTEGRPVRTSGGCGCRAKSGYGTRGDGRRAIARVPGPHADNGIVRERTVRQHFRRSPFDSRRRTRGRVVEMKQVCMIAYTSLFLRQPGAPRGRGRHLHPGTQRHGSCPERAGNSENVREGRGQDQELDMRSIEGRAAPDTSSPTSGSPSLPSSSARNSLARKSLDVVHVHNMPNFLVFAGIDPTSCPGSRSSWTFTTRWSRRTPQSSPVASADSSNGDCGCEEAICCRMARHIVCVNDIQKAAMVGRNIPEEKIVVAMNVPDPKVVRPHQEHPWRVPGKTENSG